MFFRNLTVYRFADGVVPAFPNFAEELEAHPLVEPAASQSATTGFVPAKSDPQDPQFAMQVGDFILFALGQYERILPADVIRTELAKRVSAARQQGRPHGASARRHMKEALIAEFLPRAFVRLRRTFAYLDTRDGYLVVDTATTGTAELVIAELRLALGSFPCAPLGANESVRTILTSWLRAGTASKGFRLGGDCDLRDPADKASRWSGKSIDLVGNEVKECLAGGMQAMRLGLSFDDAANFVLGDDLVIRRLRFSDDVLDRDADAAEHPGEPRYDFTADFAIQSLELRRLFEALDAVFDTPRAAPLKLDGGDAPKALRKAMRAAAADPKLRRAVERLAPKPGSGIDSVTISGPDGHIVTLTQDNAKRMSRRRRGKVPH